MSPERPVKWLPLIVFVIAVCAAGLTSGGAWGAVVGTRFLKKGAIGGAIFGATSGILAAVLWCRIMLPRIVRSRRPHADIISYGLKWGGAVGAIAGVIVYTWLALNVLNQRPYLIHKAPRLMAMAVVSGVFGSYVGMIVGLVCGWVGWLAARLALPLPPIHPKEHVQPHIPPLTLDRLASPPHTDKHTDEV